MKAIINCTEKKEVVNANDIFFTSDSHLSHRLMTAVGQNLRGFDTTLDMDTKLIEDWNKTVPQTGIVYHLGDMFLSGGPRAHEILSELNGAIHLLKGNHYTVDLQLAKSSNQILSMSDYLGIYVREDAHQSKGSMQMICMSHYPIYSWDRCHYGSWMLHGHCHGNLAPTNRKRLDEGVDTMPFRPYTYWEIKDIMNSRIISPVDHHV